MIIVVGTFEVDAADRERFLRSKAGQTATTRDEPGCIEYAFAADGVDPTRVRLIERWETMADLGAHVERIRRPHPGRRRSWRRPWSRWPCSTPRRPRRPGPDRWPGSPPDVGRAHGRPGPSAC